MAGAGYKLFNTGDVLTAAQVNTYLMEQTVMVFANAAARTTALSGVVSEGMISYLKDTNAVEVYDGSNWVSSDDPNAIQNTIVDAKGDLISASAADVPARLAVGNNGETLVADSSTSTGLRWGNNYGFAAGKNKIINGDFNIWQRGTTFNSIADGAFSADRWLHSLDGNGTFNVTRESFTAGSAPVSGYEGTYYYRNTCVTLGTSTYADIQQRVEDVRVFAGQTVTISFWLKTNAARTVNVYYGQIFGSGGSSADFSATSQFTSSTSWTRHTMTVNVPSISGKTIGTGNFGVLIIRVNTAASATFDIWGVQVEAGSVATAFQTATGTLAGELAACQRYYQKTYDLGTAPGAVNISENQVGWTYASATYDSIAGYGLKVTMRSAPTVTIYSYAGTSGKVSNNAGTDSGTSCVASLIGTNGWTKTYVTSVSSGTSYNYHFTASAEL